MKFKNRPIAGVATAFATVQRIIQRHGGNIWAESEVEKEVLFNSPSNSSQILSSFVADDIDARACRFDGVRKCDRAGLIRLKTRISAAEAVEEPNGAPADSPGLLAELSSSAFSLRGVVRLCFPCE